MTTVELVHSFDAALPYEVAEIVASVVADSWVMWPAGEPLGVLLDSSDRRVWVVECRDQVAAVLRRMGWTYEQIATVVDAFSDRSAARKAARRGAMRLGS